ncbi:MAG TPA: 3-hydroxyacyl-CoA dehydrogenase NAD-binding domain-containing protein [Gemmatimonadaceae bacterium]|jgi:3-hydroxyacyl-CoA dehydrogenase/enoyl-CoA hydratase/3-hydroxybutyryl-CoA epimerase|nr:3-hydroxyacyl-CoA dehydrogenase NAD-binding domain-containing protein [Gemmatimonadaceae bacterium]
MSVGVAPALTVDVRDSIALITFDTPNSPVNTFAPAARAEFIAVLDRLEKDSSIKAAVLFSGKPDVWIAGADVEELMSLPTAADAERLSQMGHALMERVERLRAPLIAAIQGACLGGGLELALACAYRIAADTPKTVLALPEVNLGLIPGAGGTQRLPRTVGLQQALDMILRGGNVRGRKALSTALVDELVHPAILREIALARAQAFAAGRPPARRKPGGAAAQRLLLEANPVGRAVIFRQAREQIRAKTHGNYPAPIAAIEAVAAGYSGNGYETEARLFGTCAVSEVSKNLVYIFFAQTALKKSDPGAPIRKIAVLGTGFMGAGIASVAVQQNIDVRFKDTEYGRVLKGLAAVRGVIKERLTRKQITRQQFDDMMSLVQGTIAYTGFGNVQVVIEAVFESLEVKHAVLKEVEAVVPPTTIYASNTSTIPIAKIADASRDRSHVIGMHFFSPVPKMPLLEVIVTPETDPSVTSTVRALGQRLGKTVIVVHDSPGFYVNRILAPYINEAGRMLDEGVAVDAIDRALVAFGFPVGPITLIDEVGLDIAGESGKIMSASFGARLTPSTSLERVIAAGRLGRKNRKGFYLYDDAGEKKGVDSSVYTLLPTGAQRSTIPDDDIQQRAVLAMVNEAVRCLEDGVISSARDGDIGAVMGFGFPPFRGGPFRYIDHLGADAIVKKLEELNDRYAPRFAPTELLVEHARKKLPFTTLK